MQKYSLLAKTSQSACLYKLISLTVQNMQFTDLATYVMRMREDRGADVSSTNAPANTNPVPPDPGHSEE